MLFLAADSVTPIISAQTVNALTPGYSNEMAAQTNDIEAKRLNDRANVLINKNDFNGAISNLSAAIRLNPKDPTPYEFRACCYFEIGDVNDSVTDLTKAIQLHPSFTAYLNRGNDYYFMRDYAKAMADLDQSINLCSTNDIAYKTRAAIHGHWDEYELAIKDWSQGLKLNPKDPSALVFRGQAYVNVGRFDDALNDYHDAVRMDPSNAAPYNNIAWLLATCPENKFRDGKQAIKSATKACELTNWKQSIFVDTLAAAYAEDHNYDLAVKYEKQAIAIGGTEEMSKEDMHQRLLLYELQMPYRLKVARQP